MPSWVLIRLEGSSPAMTYTGKLAEKTYGVGSSASYVAQGASRYEAEQVATYQPRTV